MHIQTLDHVALWVADRDVLADFACQNLGMHVIDRTDAFTLVGAEARRGKLTLFAAEGPREAGPLARILFHVPDLDAALESVQVPVERPDQHCAVFDAPEGLGVGLVAGRGGAPYDLAGVTLRVPDPAAARDELAGLGFADDDGRLHAGDATIALVRGHVRPPERPLLNHLGLKVESATEHQREAEQRGLDIANVVDGPNTLAVFVWGPAGVKLEYVEHKPTFSLV